MKAKAIVPITFLSDFSNAAIIFAFTLALKGAAPVWFSLLWGGYYGASFIIHAIMGLFIDKLQPVNTMLFSEVARFILMVGLMGFYDQSKFQIYEFIVIIVLIGFVEPIFHPAEIKLIYHFFKAKELDKINSILELSDQTMSIAAPIIMTYVSENWGFKMALLIIACILMLSIGVVAFTKVEIPEAKLTGDTTAHQTTTGMFDGYKYVLRKRSLKSASLVLFFANFGFGVLTPLLLPFLGEMSISNETTLYMMLNIAESSGVILGAFLFFRFSGKFEQVASVFQVIIVGICFILVAFLFSNNLILILIYSVIGLSSAFFNIQNNLSFQRHTAEFIVGKVYAFKGMVTVLGFVFGTYAGGVMGRFLSIRILFIITGCVVTASAIAVKVRETVQNGS
ncbi:MFS transporter [Lactiplantibacillus sp. WILCCON 0030]|uniref:MFS transporter n=1 Tax=Lactiplantibacillus brownii TaxID=3069269 RepID=A0ABU1AAE1_9LACO|nr:MFS transporter [Lactiplantibacillus brownii]MDQ7937943.1 MFS transporter [Lactiplantibacillus brownii]